MAAVLKDILKAQINSQIPTAGGGNVTSATLNGILNTIVDSYEDFFPILTTIQRNAIPGPSLFTGLKIFNTTSERVEIYSGGAWMPASQKGTVLINCSGNPNYPEALVGDLYRVSVTGIIGGGSGKAVNVGDLVYCLFPNAGGNEASVGLYWGVCHTSNLPTLKSVTVNATTAQLLASFTIPITLVPAVTGKAIFFQSGIVQSTFNSASYVISGNKFSIGTSPVSVCANFASNFSNDIRKGITNVSDAGDVTLVTNSALVLFAPFAVSLGDSDITLTVFYLEV